ncbi:DUF3800 domain-containing protein [Erythrobacter sp. EC-HK427]|uniref:DUF3800 domain-containing protein n=1 Tax=Erythrobacter sp. EC-HK427 TaxID=2038396 RepID=UPI001255F9F5|nr:DUF3800 domain-containing protein [Erythrobacter sp. EC-HK427]VVT04765.1 conserved hypothetical protein [Erythrobacter sp. EC-HK427]
MIRLYVDEQGTDTLTNLDQDKHRFLSLTGVALNREYARDNLVPAINSLKGDLFNEDPDEPFSLHRSHILGGNGPFHKIRTDDAFKAQFNQRITDIFVDTDYKVITALIDKQWMVKQWHWERRHPYHYLMEILVEKFAQYLERAGDIGDIMPESRQKKDRLLQSEYARVRAEGTQYVDSARIQSVLRGGSLKFRTKRDNIAGLQLCDLLAHPSHMFVREKMGHNVNRSAFSTMVGNILLNHGKYDRSASGKVKGYGYKHLP